MPNHTTTVTVNGVKYKTLKDIFPKTKTSLKILFIAKTPTLKSVEVGHYFRAQVGPQDREGFQAIKFETLFHQSFS